MTSFRNRARAVACTSFGALVVGVALAAPAAALERDDGDDPGEQMSTLEALMLFGVVPIALMLLITLLTVLPSMVKGNKKPGINWDAQPEWYGGPEGEKAPEVEAGRQALTGTVVSGGETDDGGGSSARW
ncbi:MAG: hypothetical protein ACT4QF_12080 [Sporichthyaceae bacterium]